jgi:hypothetical protein
LAVKSIVGGSVSVSSQKLRLAAVAALAAIAATGCGAAGQSQSPFVAQADPICKQVALRRLAANEGLRGKSASRARSLEALARVAPGVAAYERQALDRLRALKAPPSLVNGWRLLLAGMRVLANDTAQIGVDAKAKNYKAVQSIVSSGQRLRQQLAVVATEHGFSYCGRTS